MTIVNSTGQQIISTYLARRALVEYRHTCGRMLFIGYLPPTTCLRIRCPRCGGMAVFDVHGVESPVEATIAPNGNGQEHSHLKEAPQIEG